MNSMEKLHRVVTWVAVSAGKTAERSLARMADMWRVGVGRSGMWSVGCQRGVGGGRG